MVSRSALHLSLPALEGRQLRAAIYALQKIGVENIFLCNRTASRAIEIAEYFNGKESATGHLRGQVRLPQASLHLSYSKVFWPTGYRLPTIVHTRTSDLGRPTGELCAAE